MSADKETNACRKCGGEGQLVCRPNIFTLVGDLYTVDCEDCSNSTDNEHEKPEQAIEQWNESNPTPHRINAGGEINL